MCYGIYREIFPTPLNKRCIAYCELNNTGCNSPRLSYSRFCRFHDKKLAKVSNLNKKKNLLDAAHMYGKRLKNSLSELFKEVKSELTLVEELKATRLLALRAFDILQIANEKNSLGLEIETMKLARVLLQDVSGIVSNISEIEQRNAITPTQLEAVLRNLVSVLRNYLSPEVMLQVNKQLFKIIIPEANSSHKSTFLAFPEPMDEEDYINNIRPTETKEVLVETLEQKVLD